MGSVLDTIVNLGRWLVQSKKVEQQTDSQNTGALFSFNQNQDQITSDSNFRVLIQHEWKHRFNSLIGCPQVGLEGLRGDWAIC